MTTLKTVVAAFAATLLFASSPMLACYSYAINKNMVVNNQALHDAQKQHKQSAHAQCLLIK